MGDVGQVVEVECLEDLGDGVTGLGGGVWGCG